MSKIVVCERCGNHFPILHRGWAKYCAPCRVLNQRDWEKDYYIYKFRPKCQREGWPKRASK